MYILILIPSFFLFLYTIFKLVKDDHVFFRRNIKLDHFFDYSFIAIFVSWFVLQFVSSTQNEKLTFSLLITAVVLFIIAKYKKIPVGRFFDFFTVSFLHGATLWLFLQGVLGSDMQRYLYFLKTIVYLLISFYFRKKLLPRIMSRNLREGSLSVFFIVFYSSFSILVSIFSVIYEKTNIVSIENLLLLLMLLASIPFLLRIQK